MYKIFEIKNTFTKVIYYKDIHVGFLTNNKLELEDNFNEKLDKDFFEFIGNINDIYLGKKFNQEISLPNYVKKLAVNNLLSNWSEYLLDLDLREVVVRDLGCLPERLERLCMVVGKDVKFMGNLGVRSLVVYRFEEVVVFPYCKLGDNLRELEVGSFGFDVKFDFGGLPGSLEVLKLGSNFVGEIDFIPLSLKRLIIKSHCFNGSLHNLKNTNLKELTITSKIFNQQISGILPNTLEILRIKESNSFNQNMDFLPKNLKILDLFVLHNFNQELNNLPNIRELLLVSNSFKKPLENLPGSLEVLYLDLSGYEVKFDNLPSSLKELVLHFSDNFYNIRGLGQIERLVLRFYSDVNLNESFYDLPGSLRELVINFFCGGLDLMRKYVSVIRNKYPNLKITSDQYIKNL